MIAHKTFTNHVLAADNLVTHQAQVRDEVMQFINEDTAVAEVLDISETLIPEEGLFAVTVWYRQVEQASIEQRDLRPEEMSAELLDRAIRATQPKDAFDMLADKDMVNTTAR